MQLARVVGNVVATHKNAKLQGQKLLLVQPVEPSGQAKGWPVLAFDVVDAGIGDHVLLVQDGKAANTVLDKGVAAVDAAVVGVIDHVEMADGTGLRGA